MISEMAIVIFAVYVSWHFAKWVNNREKEIEKEKNENG